MYIVHVFWNDEFENDWYYYENLKSQIILDIPCSYHIKIWDYKSVNV